jgi:membrane protein implicated in regulation of membrane protease activity
MIAILDLGLDLNVWPWVWLGVAVVFAIVELTVLAGTFVLLPFALSAFVAALAGWYDAPIEAQWAIFILGGAALWALFWKYAKRFMAEHTNPEGVGADRLVGMTAIVTKPIDPDDVDRRGRVKVAGEDWGALTEGRGLLAEGTKVQVTAMSGTRVIVIPLDMPLSPPPASGPPLNRPASPAEQPARKEQT